MPLFDQSHVGSRYVQSFSTTSKGSFGGCVLDAVLASEMPVRSSVTVSVSAVSTTRGVTAADAWPPLKLSEPSPSAPTSLVGFRGVADSLPPL